ncbi:erythromycin esterase family protein [Paenibacillus bouchesdurhonensis]|uniref:erythromycin esterase family protein n=1 Tax=Paenibacillus bouchesdurhonensis TaxID=1870990 RepID=UPI000DA61EBC|nr:erythromycin esterase family protein [Paenibacillus bouchesdurhonensis]
MSVARLFLSAVILLTFITGCGAVGGDVAEKYVSPVENMDVPNDVTIIGLGEATHGNVEFQELKKTVFEALIKNENVRIFVLEGDFGAGQQINDYILHGNGTAKEAVFALDYGIYKTQQMIDLVEWLHEYNETANENDRVYFYGNDMQRYDASKKGLLAFYETVNEEMAKKYTAQLQHVSNDTMRNLTAEQLEELHGIIDDIITDLQTNEEEYSEQTSQESYAFALQYANVMKQRTSLLGNDKQYTMLRDEYLAENVKWIVEFEAQRGHDKLFISAHNGHIEKTSAAFGYKSMGDYLDEMYGNHYFAIGTDFINNTFQANNGANKRENHTINNSDPLVKAFSEVESNIFYVDFELAINSKEIAEIISQKQRMPNIGDDFSTWYKASKKLYTLEMVPNEAYDGMIIVKEATPTTVME